MQTLLELQDVSCAVNEDENLFENVHLTVSAGEIVVLQGRSGCGKSTLLKCIAHLVHHGGKIFYRGSTPQAYGVPLYRTRVLYVPQHPSLLPGTPCDFMETVTSFASHKAVSRKGPIVTTPATTAASGNGDACYGDDDDDWNALGRAKRVGRAWNIDPVLWGREWGSLSGGEAQRIVLAAAVGMGTAEVLLLDEPTSALDSETSALVEEYLMEEVAGRRGVLQAIIWVTHSQEQGKRVAKRILELIEGGCYEASLIRV